jgi:hypothetical protein
VFMPDENGHPFALALAFFDTQGRAIHCEPLPARKLRRICRVGQFAADAGSPAWKGCSVTLRPLGLRRGELPARCDGIELTLNGSDVVRVWEVPSERFGWWALEAIDALAVAERLASTERCTWELLALPVGEAVPDECVIVSPLELPPVRFRVGRRPDEPGVNVLHPEYDYLEGVPFFVARRALEEAIAFCRVEPALERGGVFLGRLYADSMGAFVLSEIFAPAWDAPAEAARMRFDRTTWERIHQRRVTSGEPDLDVVAWLHSHTRHQSENGEDVAGPVLAPSVQDMAIHAAFFPDPHLSCLIVDSMPDGLAQAVAVWGWDRYGIKLQRRTLHVFGGRYG